jgi:L-amino acid N-acyltransferase YncA
MIIRPATTDDYDAIWDIFSVIIRTGDTYVFDPNTPKPDLQKIWFGNHVHTFVAVQENAVVGSYRLRANQPDLGDHVANCGYIVSPLMRGQGIGKALCAHSLETAKQLGFLAMQFNYVVSTNTSAVRLWQHMGFEIIGTTPKSYRHATLGLVDTFIMYREL